MTISIRKIIGAGIKLILLLSKQEKLLFHPETLPIEFKFIFKTEVQELTFNVDADTNLNGLLFHADSSKGLVFYLHGNFGTNALWGHAAYVYLKNNYDFFTIDYRGYGKSQGHISDEKHFFKDIQIVYDSLRKEYDERKILIVGYSIGTGLASQLASTNNPKLLMLIAPFFNIAYLAKKYFPFIPSFLIKFKFRTNEYITKVKCPIIIFHGNRDDVIDYSSSLKLKNLFKQEDRLIILDGQKHDCISENRIFQNELKIILN